MHFRVHPSVSISDDFNYCVAFNAATGVRAAFSLEEREVLVDLFARKILQTGSPSLSDAFIIDSNFAIDLFRLTFLVPEVDWQDLPCPCCGTNGHCIRMERYDPRFARVFCFVKCSKCEAVYLRPSPDKSLMKFLYGDVCLYSNRQLDSKRPYIEWTHKRSRSRRLGITSSSFGKDHIGVFLDVGCGTSSFLNNCYQLGWDVWGVDIDPSAIAHQRAECPEGKFFASAFLDAQLPEDHFDFVSFWSYFEHEQEQTASLSKARKCLKQGGLLVIEVPDVGGRLVGFSGRYWPYWDPPFHVVHHGTRSLQRLLDKSGFKVVSTQKHGTSPLYFKYSPLLLCAFTALQRSYNSKAMDVLVSGISRATLPLEEILGLAGKLVVVAAKSD